MGIKSCITSPGTKEIRMHYTSAKKHYSEKLRTFTEFLRDVSWKLDKETFPVTVVSSVPWVRKRDITVVAVIVARPGKRCSVSDSDVKVAGSAFILPRARHYLHDSRQLASHLDWREPIELQEWLEGRSSHNGEFLCDVSFPLLWNRGYDSNQRHYPLCQWNGNLLACVTDVCQ